MLEGAPRKAGGGSHVEPTVLVSLLGRGLGGYLGNWRVSAGMGGVWVWVPLAG